MTSLIGNQFFERLLLIFTDKAAYPPSHYLRRVPTAKVHLFTTIQLVQLIVLAAVGFYSMPYLKLVFPLLILVLLPVRHWIVPKFFKPSELDAIDGHQ